MSPKERDFLYIFVMAIGGEHIHAATEGVNLLASHTASRKGVGHFTTETASPEGAIALRDRGLPPVFRNDFYGTLQNFRGGAVIFLQRDSFLFRGGFGPDD